MLKKISIVISLFFGITSCNNDDNDYNSVIFEACNGVKQIEEVTVSNMTIEAVETDNLRGYLFKADIKNNTDFEIQDGSVNITFFVENTLLNYTVFGDCSSLLSNSSCELVDFFYVETNGNVDQNPVLGCFYYEL